MLKALLICTIGIPYLVLVRYFPLQKIFFSSVKKVCLPLLLLITHTHETAMNTYFHFFFFFLLFVLYDAVVLCTVGLLFSLGVQSLICAVFYDSNKKKVSFIIRR